MAEASQVTVELEVSCLPLLPQAEELAKQGFMTRASASNRAFAEPTMRIEGEPTATGMGNPHCTFFVDDIEEVNLEERGAAHEHHPLYPERTNVQHRHNTIMKLTKYSI